MWHGPIIDGKSTYGPLSHIISTHDRIGYTKSRYEPIGYRKSANEPIGYTKMKSRIDRYIDNLKFKFCYEFRNPKIGNSSTGCYVIPCIISIIPRNANSTVTNKRKIKASTFCHTKYMRVLVGLYPHIHSKSELWYTLWKLSWYPSCLIVYARTSLRIADLHTYAL